MSAAPGRPKRVAPPLAEARARTRAPSGGSAVRAATSVGASS